jgi:4'-phosphopantetheinyl transferase EntD
MAWVGRCPGVGVIEELLPAAVAAVEAFEDPPDPVVLFPEEEAVLGRAVQKRRQEFSTARACARGALAKLGLPPAPIVPGLRGAPGWPPGVVGSITHCAGYRACAVALTGDAVTIGLDAEPNEALPEGVLDAIAIDEEKVRLRRLCLLAPEVSWGRLLFSAKESVYKAWFPLTQRWLDFEQAAITFEPETFEPEGAVNNGTFVARLLVPGPVVQGRALTRFDGRWMVRNGLVVTAIAVLTEP